MILEWFHWAILGVALVSAELLVPAFVLVWFGLGALVVAVLVAVVPQASFIVQLLIWIMASVALVLLWFKVFKTRLHRTVSGLSSAEAVGEPGLLVSDIGPFQKAKVRFQTPLFGSDIWECVSDEEIEAGTRVYVVSVDGSILKISREKKS